MSYKKMHIRLFPLCFFYESCFGNNIVTTSDNLPHLAYEADRDTLSVFYMAYLKIFTLSVFPLSLKSKWMYLVTPEWAPLVFPPESCLHLRCNICWELFVIKMSVLWKRELLCWGLKAWRPWRLSRLHWVLKRWSKHKGS